MNSNTLQGIFPEPKPVHRRNFIKENVRYIKQMQGIVQTVNPPRYQREPRYMHVPSKVAAQINHQPSLRSRHKISSPRIKMSRSVSNSKMPRNLIRKNSLTNKEKLHIKQMREFGQVPRRMEDESPEKFTDRSVQTEKSNDLKKIYEHGVIKFPSSSVLSAINSLRRKAKQIKHQDRGDSVNRSLSPKNADLSERVHNLDLEDRDFIKENVKAVRHKVPKNESNLDPNRAPPNYQKGVVPKYLKDLKEEIGKGEEDPECPPGHVLLPDEERKETLRVLRQSYADRIQELNSMPVRNDTLRMRRRKMELEEELKKIDEGIKVFQRPKVFVKINA